MIVAIFGADELGVRRRLQQLKDETDGGSGMLASNLSVIEGVEAKAADIIAPAMAQPFLGPRRLVLVTGLLERYEAKGGRPPRSLAAFEPLFEAFEAGLPPTTTVAFTGGDLRRNAFVDRLKKVRGALTEEFAELKGDALLRYIRDEAAARGLRFRGGAAAGPDADGYPRPSDPVVALANLVQGNTLAIASELDKLALYTMGRDATVEDVGVVCAGERHAATWDFTDAVMDGDPAKAFRALALLLRDGEERQALLAILTTGYRTTATILDMLEDRATPEAIGQAIRRPWPGLRDRAIQRAQRLGREGLLAAYAAIVETDRAHKSGEADPDVAFDLLVVQLAGLARRGSTAGRR